MNLSDLEYIALNMRECDRAEIYGMRADDNPLMVARQTMMAGMGRVFHHKGRPAAVCGAIELHEGVWSAFAYGTDEFGSVVKEMTRWARGPLKAFLMERAHRIECQSRFDHESAHRWLQAFGAHLECVLRKYGKDGADYHQYVWTR